MVSPLDVLAPIGAVAGLSAFVGALRALRRPPLQFEPINSHHPTPRPEGGVEVLQWKLVDEPETVREEVREPHKELREKAVGERSEDRDDR